MNSTYQRVWENVDAEWKYSKCFFQVHFFIPWSISLSGHLILKSSKYLKCFSHVHLFISHPSASYLSYSGSVPNSKSNFASSIQMGLLPRQDHQVRNVQIHSHFSLSQVLSREIKVVENFGQDRRGTFEANGRLHGVVAEACEDEDAFRIRGIKD